MSVADYMQQLGAQAKAASKVLATAPTMAKNNALLSMANALNNARSALKTANQKDLSAAEKNGLAESMLDRFIVTHFCISSLLISFSYSHLLSLVTFLVLVFLLLL